MENISVESWVGMNQTKTPLFTRLYQHQQSSPYSFHVPGHKNGQVFLEAAKATFERILTIDQTEISGLDDLHGATGIIAEAQHLAADLYQVEATHFLVGGSTVGNIAMMMTVAERGETVLVQRNSHQSVFHGLELAGLRPVFLEPEWDDHLGLALGVARETLEYGVINYPEAKAVFLTHPSYEGYGQDLARHVELVHQAGMMVCVDEAHGAHLIHDDGDAVWPRSSLKAGADIVVQSAHKVLPAMTMASYIHINSQKVDKVKLRNYLRMLQSSSPSYPLMASLDVARAYLASLTLSDWWQITENISKFKNQLVSGPGWKRSAQITGNYLQDPLKVAFATPYVGAAYEWQKRLEQEAVYPELVSPQHLLLTLPLYNEAIDDKEWVPRLEKILCLSEQQQCNFFKQPILQEQANKLHATELVFSFEDMKQLAVQRQPWEKCEGFVGAETITPYPPGIPLILKGERIRSTHLSKLKHLVQEGAFFQTGTNWIQQGMTIFIDRGD
ncbi:aminotransferase class I/II-fold pyridoxal phosphate-dependent enzyme [Salipaludibacillus sp. HK11]|uniref:aminotransferase class I/II-fold pyridoxal phosphate-dependent enzyme n=1 Tax=Salipaludibacillus sp. HK11 TaxID=3394320 RepID=UPI0039FC6331